MHPTDPYDRYIMDVFGCSRCNKMRKEMCYFCMNEADLRKAAKNVFGVDVGLEYLIDGRNWELFEKLFRKKIISVDCWDNQMLREVKLFAGPNGKALWKAIVIREGGNV